MHSGTGVRTQGYSPPSVSLFICHKKKPGSHKSTQNKGTKTTATVIKIYGEGTKPNSEAKDPLMITSNS